MIKEILESLANRVNLLIRTNIVKPFQAVSSDITEIIYNHERLRTSLNLQSPKRYTLNFIKKNPK
ncbi:MAG: hypothetical protein V1667_00095 [bacterium]